MVWYHKLKKKKSPWLWCEPSPSWSWTALDILASGWGAWRAQAWSRLLDGGTEMGWQGGDRGDLGALPGLAGMKGWSQVGRPREKTPLASVLGWKIHSHPQQKPWYTTSRTHRCSERENINRETLTRTFLNMITHTHAHTHTHIHTLTHIYTHTHIHRILIRPLISGTTNTRNPAHQNKHPNTYLPMARNIQTHK